VPLYGWGRAAEGVTGLMDNTDLFALMTGLPKPPAAPAARQAAASGVR
jgi:hypothetical protein